MTTDEWIAVGQIVFLLTCMIAGLVLLPPTRRRK